MANKSIRYVTAKLSAVEHNALIMRASERGKHITELAAEYIRDGMIAESDSKSLEVRLFRASYEAKKRDLYRAQLEHIAHVAIRDESESMMDELHELCAEAGLDVNDVIECANRMAAGMSQSGESGKALEVKVFIASLLREGAVGAKEAMEAAKVQGFAEGMVNRIKREMGVISRRDGARFIWEMPGMKQESGSKAH